jgi:hypothetical protein
MSNKGERGGCRFSVRTAEGKPIIEMQLFHDTVPRLAEARLTFEMLSGATLEETRKLAEAMNDRIIGVVVTPK